MKNILKDKSLVIKDNAYDILSYIKDYDILLLDIHLDNINKFDVIEILRKNEIKILIIVITADTNNYILEKLHKLNILINRL